MWQLLPPTALLLLVSDGMQEGLQKSVVSLEPQWVRVLKEDNVTLKCQGAYPPGDNSTKWWHNGSSISNQASSYFIGSARVEDSGQYMCQTGLSPPSDPVQLEVHSDWLLLQTSRLVFQEGEPILLKCHSWRNKLVHKVTYLRNGKGLRFFPQNSEFSIPEATLNHTGSYFCRGLIGNKNLSSETVNIIVQGPVSPSILPVFPPWHQITFCLMMGVMFVVDTGLYFSVQRNLRSSVSKQKEHKLQWIQEPQNK